MLADVRGWAYDIIAQSLRPFLQDQFDIRIAYVADVKAGQRLNFDDYDLIYAFHWLQMARMGPYYYDNYDPAKVVVGIHSESLPAGLGLAEANLLLADFAAVGCTSLRLQTAFAPLRPVFTPNGYDPEVFYPAALPPLNQGLKAIWVGNPDPLRHGSNKGLNEILRPALAALPGVSLAIASRQKALRYQQMGHFYRSGHLYLCASQHEGTPLPLLEAMACGRPVLTTAVGIAAEVVDDGCGLVLPRCPQAFRRAVQQLSFQPERLQAMGQQARVRVQDRTWAWAARGYRELLERVPTSGTPQADVPSSPKSATLSLALVGPQSRLLHERARQLERLGARVEVHGCPTRSGVLQGLLHYWRFRRLKVDLFVLQHLQPGVAWPLLASHRPFLLELRSVDVLTAARELPLGYQLLRDCCRQAAGIFSATRLNESWEKKRFSVWNTGVLKNALQVRSPSFGAVGVVTSLVRGLLRGLLSKIRKMLPG